MGTSATREALNLYFEGFLPSRVFVAPAMFETTHANARFAALDMAPPAYEEVLVSA